MHVLPRKSRCLIAAMPPLRCKPSPLVPTHGFTRENTLCLPSTKPFTQVRGIEYSVEYLAATIRYYNWSYQFDLAVVAMRYSAQ